MSTSLCGKICITLPRCSRKERRHNFDSRCSIAATAAMSWRHCVFHCESKTTLFGLPKEDTTRNQWLSCIYNTVPEQFNRNICVCNAFYGGLFPEPNVTMPTFLTHNQKMFSYLKNLPLMIQKCVLSSAE